MVLSPADDFPMAKSCSLDDLPQEGHWAVMTYTRNDEAKLQQLHDIMLNRLIVAEVWKALLPQASIMISSAISGGSLKERFQEAAKERSCWLLLDPMRVTFPLPFPDGKELPTTHMPEHGFYSDALLCYYAHFSGITRSHVVLWDTEETIKGKMQLAKSCGFCGFIDKRRLFQFD